MTAKSILEKVVTYSRDRCFKLLVYLGCLCYDQTLIFYLKYVNFLYIYYYLITHDFILI